MSNIINYSVHANPLKDDQGRTTYQVRHDIRGTLNTGGRQWPDALSSGDDPPLLRSMEVTAYVYRRNPVYVSE